MNYFSAMLCQNIVPQNKMKKMKFGKKFIHRSFFGMFRLIHSVRPTTTQQLFY